MPASPSTQNYQFGAGVCSLKIDGVDIAFRDIGNVPSLTYSPTITFLEHKQSRSGLRSTDFKVAKEVAATIKCELEEVTPANMALFVLGEVTGGNVIGGLTLTKIEGDFKFVGDNAFGQNITFTSRVSVTPSGDFQFLSDDVNKIPLSFEVLEDAGEFGHWVFTENSA